MLTIMLKGSRILLIQTLTLVLCLCNGYLYAQKVAFTQKYSALNIPTATFQNYAVTAVTMDHYGRIWTGTLNGLYVTKGNVVSFCPLQDPNDKIISSLVLRGKYLYVGSNKGINRIVLDSLQAKELLLKDDKGTTIHNYCMVVSVNNKNKLLFYTGYNTGAYYEYDLQTGKSSFLFNHSDGYRALKTDNTGNLKKLWAVETTGLLEHDTEVKGAAAKLYFKGESGRPVLSIHEAHLDNTDTLWCATDKGLLGMDINTHLYKLLDFPEYGVYQLMDVVMSGQNILCGTKDAGIIIYNRQGRGNKRIVHKPDDPYSLLSDKIWQLKIESDKLLIAATDKGISVITLDSSLQHVFTPLKAGAIHNIKKGKYALLCGIGNEIVLVRPYSFEVLRTVTLAIDEFSFTAQEIDDKNWLVVTNKRVVWLNKEQLKVIQAKPERPVLCERIIKESDSSYYLCGQTGMYRWGVGDTHFNTLHQTDREPYSWYSTIIPVNDSIILANAYLSFVKVLARQGNDLHPKATINMFSNVNDYLVKDNSILLAGTNGLSYFDKTSYTVSDADTNFHENVHKILVRGGDTLLIGDRNIYRFKSGHTQVKQDIYSGFLNISNKENMLADNAYIWFTNGGELYRMPFFNMLKTSPYFFVNIYNRNRPISNSVTLHANDNLQLNVNSICYLPYVGYKIQYKLSGIENTWTTLDGSHIRYTQLQPGNYTLAIRVLSGTQTLYDTKISITAKPAWYQTTLFYILVLAAIAGIAILIFRWRIAIVRKKSDTALRLQRKMNELENKALRAQMNPHFLFNTLNSINHYILNNETNEASHYLTRFSKLVRLVLDNSRKEWISLERELEALNIYLELEMMRRNNEFDYSISVRKGVEAGSFVVPPLILQPFVENAIWHGLSSISKEGFIEIVIVPEGDDGVCITIEDNGIGYTHQPEREAAKAHNSFGMAGTRDRLELMHPKNRYTIEPLYSEDGKLSGTRVSIFIYND